MKKKITFLMLLLSFYNQAQTVTTVAGTGLGGLVDGPANSSLFNDPVGLVIDSNENIFVLEIGNHCIRKITPSGNVTTFAGSVQGYADGNGANAKFDRPFGIAIDANDNLYVADTWNNKIRKIDPLGNVTTFAGSDSGYLDGNGIQAKFNNPRGLVVDSNGNVFVTDTWNRRIRKITSAGVVTTFAGSGSQGNQDGVGTVAQFYELTGIVIDSNDNLYVSDHESHRIRKITPSSQVTTFAGSNRGYVHGYGTTAAFSYPHGLAIDNNNVIYVADMDNSKIRKITPDGYVDFFAGFADGYLDGVVTNARFMNPYGVITDNQGNVFVADTNNNRIRKITPNNLSVSDFYLNNKVLLYPNPVNDVLTIQNQDAISINNYSVIDVNGRVLVNQSKEIQNNQINLTDLGFGIYILQLETDKGFVTKKIIKE